MAKRMKLEPNLDKGFPDTLICPLDPSVKLSNQEFQVFCVYDRSHRVINDQYDTHLDKCRRNYVMDMEKKGTCAKMVNCTINPTHQAFSPELLFHEHICPDKVYVEVEALYLKEPELWQSKLYFIESEVNVLKNEKNPARVNGRLIELGMSLNDKSVDNFDNIDVVTEYLIKLIRERPTSLSEVQNFRYKMLKIPEKPSKKKSTPQQRNKPRVMKTPWLDEEVLLDLKPIPDKKMKKLKRHPRIPIPLLPRPIPSSIASGDFDGELDWDNWGLDGDGPGFSASVSAWLERQFQLGGIMRMYPPGVPRAERRNRMETERLRIEEGVVATENSGNPPTVREQNDQVEDMELD